MCVSHSVSPINGLDISCLFENPFNFGEAIMICNVALNVKGNVYNKHRFNGWDFYQYDFETTIACCIVEMFYQIANETQYETHVNWLHHIV